MIISYLGTPGSGKTYEAVSTILENLKMGRVVFTNIDGLQDPVCREAIKVVCGLSDLAISRLLHFLPDEQVEDFWNHISPGSLVVVDEVQNFFNARDWQNQRNSDLGKWASMTRHAGFDVIFISQSVEGIDAQVRRLFQWSYVFRKIDFFGSVVTNSYMQYAYVGAETHGKPFGSQKKTFNSRVFACYKSYFADGVHEKKFRKSMNVLKHPVFYAIPLVLALTIYLVFFKSSLGSGDLFGLESSQKSKSPVVGSSVESEVLPDVKNEISRNVFCSTQPNGVQKCFSLKK